MDTTAVRALAPAQHDLRRQDDAALQYRVFRSFSEARCLKDEWNDLAVRAGDILCSYDWCETWWKYFNRWRRLEIHTLYDGPRLVAALPLFRETIHPGGVGLRTVRVLGCDYTIGTVGLAIEPAYAEDFTRMLLDQLEQDGPWDILEIAPLRFYNSITERIGTACIKSANVQTVVAGRHDSWDTFFCLPDTYEAFLASLPGKIRRETHRRERLLGQQHQVEVESVSSLEQLHPAMDALIQLHQEHWTSKGHPGQLRQGPVRQFHREVAERTLGAGRLMLLTLKVDGRIVAANYGCRLGSRLHHLFVGLSHDEQYRSYGLGEIMYFHVIRDAIEHGVKMLEDGRGIFPHKQWLGGQVDAERALIVLRCGYGARLRFWAALRGAYFAHVLCNRVWSDLIAGPLRMPVVSWDFYVRNAALLQMFRNIPLRLFDHRSVIDQCHIQ